jgi:recombination protein RecA
MAKAKAKTEVKAKAKAEGKKEDLKISPEKAFKLTSNTVDKDFPNAIHTWAHETDRLEQKRFSSGSINIDTSLGGKGLPNGRIIEIWGPSGGGKTSLALDIAWNMQRQTGLGVVFFDIEHKFDKTLFARWRGQGFIPHMTKYEEPFSGEDFFAMLARYVESEGTGIIIADSISGIKQTKVLEQDDQQTHYGTQANIISQYLPKISGSAARTGVPMLFINQVRANLDAHPKAKSKLKILKKGGGFAFDHWICISFFMDRGQILTDGNRELGHWAKVAVYKNHAGDTLFKEFKLKLIYGLGFDMAAELASQAVDLSIFPKTSAGSSHYQVDQDGTTVHGEEQVAQYVAEHPEVQQALWNEIQAMHLSGRNLQEKEYIQQIEWVSDGAEGIIISGD